MTPRQQIKVLVEELNRLTNETYIYTYHSGYGGYNLYVKEPNNNGTKRSTYGFDYRKSPRECIAYLDGIIKVLTNK